MEAADDNYEGIAQLGLDRDIAFRFAAANSSRLWPALRGISDVV
jgi:hypothetical protein